MADFIRALAQVIENEGGYVLRQRSGTRKAVTFAGIDRNFYPNWSGWYLVDANPANPEIIQYVKGFYRAEFWERMRGDFIVSDWVAQSIFDFAVSMGVTKAAGLTQQIIGTKADGVIGAKSLTKLNDFDEERFLFEFTLRKVIQYTEVINRTPSNAPLLLGWLNRAIKPVGLFSQAFRN